MNDCTNFYVYVDCVYLFIFILIEIFWFLYILSEERNNNLKIVIEFVWMIELIDSFISEFKDLIVLIFIDKFVGNLNISKLKGPAGGFPLHNYYHRILYLLSLIFPLN